MPTGKNLFTGQVLTATAAASPVAVPVGDVDFIAVGITVNSVTGAGATATFGIQWSFDGSTWAEVEPEDVIATMTAVGTKIKRFPVKAPYWRIGAQVGGTTPVFTVTGNALVW